MAILDTDLKLKKSIFVHDGAGNGGRMDPASTEVATDIKNNLLPDIPHAERISGFTRYRKFFVHVAPSANLTLADASVCIERHTPGDDVVVMMSGTQTDIQSDAVAYTRHYGCAPLNANVSSGAVSIQVNVEPGNGASGGREIFKSGDKIRITSRETITSTSGTEDVVRLASTGGVSWSGTVATLSFASGQSLANSYLASVTRVSSLMELGDVAAAVTGWAESSGTGTYDETAHPVVASSKGSILQTWTVTFTSATAYSVTGDTVGSIGTGSVSADFSPSNTNMSAPYFTIPASGFGGTWATGDTITFTTHPAAAPFWLKHVGPPGAGSYSGNTTVLAIFGQSA
ncbi:MAG: hypothetical protein HQM01_10090 [Magnetococcales bacterium]|nr:hypothetical protein [Magnetococcales bacterium]